MGGEGSKKLRDRKVFPNFLSFFFPFDIFGGSQNYPGKKNEKLDD